MRSHSFRPHALALILLMLSSCAFGGSAWDQQEEPVVDKGVAAATHYAQLPNEPSYEPAPTNSRTATRIDRERLFVVQEISERATANGCPGGGADPQGGYQVAVGETEQDYNDLAAVLHSAGWYVDSAIYGPKPCSRFLYCYPFDPSSICPRSSITARSVAADLAKVTEQTTLLVREVGRLHRIAID